MEVSARHIGGHIDLGMCGSKLVGRSGDGGCGVGVTRDRFQEGCELVEGGNGGCIGGIVVVRISIR